MYNDETPLSPAISKDFDWVFYAHKLFEFNTRFRWTPAIMDTFGDIFVSAIEFVTLEKNENITVIQKLIS